MPEEDRLVYAKWEAADVGYTRRRYIEGTNGTYEAQTPVKMNGRTEEEVSPVPKRAYGICNTAAAYGDCKSRRQPGHQLLIMQEINIHRHSSPKKRRRMERRQK